MTFRWLYIVEWKLFLQRSLPSHGSVAAGDGKMFGGNTPHVFSGEGRGDARRNPVKDNLLLGWNKKINKKLLTISLQFSSYREMFLPTLFPSPRLLHHLSVNESTFLGNGPQGPVEYFTNKIEPRVRLLHHVVLRLAATTVDANFPGEKNQ